MGLWIGHDLEDKRVELDTDSLLRHFLCLGSSGSGKTVACKILCEEFLKQALPVIAVDPQGDIASMLLPRVEKERQQDIDDFFQQVEVLCWTPGSEVGIPLCLNPLNLNNLPQKTSSRVRAISFLASNLTSLLGYSPESKDHSFVSAFFDLVLQFLVREQRTFANLKEFSTFLKAMPPELQQEIADIIEPKKVQEVQRKLAVFGIGAKKLLFQFGVPLSIEQLLGLQQDSETTRLSVLYLNTLQTQEEKEFFVAQLTQALYDWMLEHPQKEPQALFFIDEVSPFLPPIRRPNCKEILTLLFKQARKYGICCLLSTQNPGDIDYKALSQFSTWMLGRLFTNQDLKKIAPILRSLGEEQSATIKNLLPSLPSGEFVLLSSEEKERVIRMNLRQLYSQHETIDEIRLEEIVTEEQRQSWEPHYLGEQPSPSSIDNIETIEVKEEKEESQVSAKQEASVPSLPTAKELSSESFANQEAEIVDVEFEEVGSSPTFLSQSNEESTALVPVHELRKNQEVALTDAKEERLQQELHEQSLEEDKEKINLLEKKLQLVKLLEPSEEEEGNKELALDRKIAYQTLRNEQEQALVPSQSYFPSEDPEIIEGEIDYPEILPTSLPIKAPEDKSKKSKDTKTRLVEFFGKHPGAYSIQELSKELQLTPGTLRHHLKELEESDDDDERIASTRLSRSLVYWLEKDGFIPSESIVRPILAIPFQSHIERKYVATLAKRSCDKMWGLFARETTSSPQPRYSLFWRIRLKKEEEKGILHSLGSLFSKSKDEYSSLYFHAETGSLLQSEHHQFSFLESLEEDECNETIFPFKVDLVPRTPSKLFLSEQDFSSLKSPSEIWESWRTYFEEERLITSCLFPGQLVALPYWEVVITHKKKKKRRFFHIDGVFGKKFSPPRD